MATILWPWKHSVRQDTFFIRQLMEPRLSEHEFLKMHANHYLASKVLSDNLFNEGFSPIEYISCALLVMVNNSLSEYNDHFDLATLKMTTSKMGMSQGIITWHCPDQFLHCLPVEVMPLDNKFTCMLRFWTMKLLLPSVRLAICFMLR